MVRLLRTYRILPDSILKLKSLSEELDIPMSRLVEMMIGALWTQKENRFVTAMTEQMMGEEAKKILDELVK